MSFKYEVQVHGEGDKWHTNGVAFATFAEADNAGYNKMFNWMMCTDYRVVESTDPVNYRWNPETGLEGIEEVHAATV